MEFLLHVAVVVSIYAILAMSLDLMVGHAGLLSITQAGFYGLGAYTAGLLGLYVGLPFGVACLLSMIVGAILSQIIALASVRVHDDYFVLATFAFQMILFAMFNNFQVVTQGPLGISGIPRPTVFGWAVSSHADFLVLSGAFAVMAHFIVRRITTSQLGRILRGIREDESFTQSLGRDTVRAKLVAVAVSAALASLAGSLYAHYITYIDPTSFTVMESILVLSMVIIGGAGSMWGPLVGAIVLVTLPEALRFLGLPTAAAANLRQIIYGALLVFIMMVRPKGLVGRYAFRR
ncbi:MAG TPA: branched-chain amino acid ABC transporter permease [Phycisphaerae bacterium]|nr:branched-chain amino acid ABC transporter permease [Phycisphaerae bacterium]